MRSPLIGLLALLLTATAGPAQPPPGPASVPPLPPGRMAGAPTARPPCLTPVPRPPLGPVCPPVVAPIGGFFPSFGFFGYPAFWPDYYPDLAPQPRVLTLYEDAAPAAAPARSGGSTLVLPPAPRDPRAA